MDPHIWEPVAEHCARLGPKFRFFTLGKYAGFKAGALNFALRETAPDAEIVGVIDSDYIVDPDWLRCMAPAFADPKVGFTQSPQDYRDNDGSFFKRLMFWEYAGFFQAGMVTRNERNAIIQHGTMTLIRKQALLNENGWAEWCITEDSQLGLRLFRAGYEAVYSKKSFGKGVMPDDFTAFRKQRYRWAYGAMRITRANAAALFNPFNKELSTGQRWHFITGWLPWMGDALGLVFLALGLAWSLGLILDPVRFEFPIALFMLPSIGLFVFKIFQILALYKARVACSGAGASDGPRGICAPAPNLERVTRRRHRPPLGHPGNPPLVRRPLHPVPPLPGLSKRLHPGSPPRPGAKTGNGPHPAETTVPPGRHAPSRGGLTPAALATSLRDPYPRKRVRAEAIQH
jgi:cellulose synthase/poly-beta-1,6-N-acetylglucosamine synthase-like glycosyltransferase